MCRLSLASAPAAPPVQLLRSLVDEQRLGGSLDSLAALVLLQAAEQPLADCLVVHARQVGRSNKLAWLVNASLH